VKLAVKTRSVAYSDGTSYNVELKGTHD
jgi:hypothetical protein